MGTNRTWTVRVCSRCGRLSSDSAEQWAADDHYCDSGLFVSVVEESRLREAEAERDEALRELQQVDAILELADAPTEEYAAQAGGMVTFTRAGRVNWLRHRARGVLDDTGPVA